MRFREIILIEAQQQSVRVYHGSPYRDISEFRFDNLRHRTGTPGTLSFTTSEETARIYGSHVYEVEVQGTFGDYRDPDDVEKAFAWRWPKHEDWLKGRVPDDYDWDRSAAKLRKEIASGFYAQWENVALWRSLGWDGAWFFESDSRNLVVGRNATIRLVGKVTGPLKALASN